MTMPNESAGRAAGRDRARGSSRTEHSTPSPVGLSWGGVSIALASGKAGLSRRAVKRIMAIVDEINEARCV